MLPWWYDKPSIYRIMQEFIQQNMSIYLYEQMHLNRLMLSHLHLHIYSYKNLYLISKQVHGSKKLLWCTEWHARPTKRGLDSVAIWKDWSIFEKERKVKLSRHLLIINLKSTPCKRLIRFIVMRFYINSSEFNMY